MHDEIRDMISVIIPVYEVEQFLDKCIKSVICQTYNNLEIILVDDGSLDRSGSICDKWAKQDFRIKVIHKENGGLSDARNVGLQIASGKYVSFIDSDDWISPKMFEILIEQFQENNFCDVSICKIKKVYTENDVIESEDKKNTFLISGKEALKELIYDHMSQVVWNKLYRKSLIENIYFEVGKYHEDEFWSYQVMGKARMVALTNYVGYFYRQRQGSIMGEKYSVRRLDAIEAKCRRQIYLESYYPEFTSIGKINLLFSCLYHGQLSLRSINRSDRIIIHNYLHEIFRKYRLSKLEKNMISLKHKIWLVGATYVFTLVCRIRNYLKIGM